MSVLNGYLNLYERILKVKSLIGFVAISMALSLSSFEAKAQNSMVPAGGTAVGSPDSRVKKKPIPPGNAQNIPPGYYRPLTNAQKPKAKPKDRIQPMTGANPTFGGTTNNAIDDEGLRKPIPRDAFQNIPGGYDRPDGDGSDINGTPAQLDVSEVPGVSSGSGDYEDSQPIDRPPAQATPPGYYRPEVGGSDSLETMSTSSEAGGIR